MQVILSPSKTQSFDTQATAKAKLPKFLAKTENLVEHLKAYSVDELASLMKISDKLALQTFKDFKNWRTEYRPDSQTKFSAAIYAYQGVAFSGFELEQYSPDDLAFLDEHINILSGLYGVLSSLDLIQAYRLELGLKLVFEINQKQYKNLYDYWRNDINDILAQKTKIIINLASLEYSKIIDKKRFKVVNIEFKINKNNKLKTVAIYAKQQRGRFTNWIVKNKIESLQELEEYHNDGFEFRGLGSSLNNLLFVKDG